jgi:kelch-like protein 10
MSRPRLPHELLLAIGGWSGGSPTNSIEAYDSRANMWVNVTNKMEKFRLERPRAYHGVCSHNESVYVLGGFDGQNYFNSVRRLDLRLFECFEEPPMNNRRCYISRSGLTHISDTNFRQKILQAQISAKDPFSAI